MPHHPSTLHRHTIITTISRTRRTGTIIQHIVRHTITPIIVGRRITINAYIIDPTLLGSIADV
ncbi:hypothetical protein QU481_18685 [Crenobacter sp. SG2303]|uniref:Uncharacterized protein n=1 Tax=Crenobacter oryzisoli TaxID=3056844 RepID=A0ABT7XSV3_9NEIS|nr:hypothetical protein [Crenobacter sp. SG2303]MDN0076875.1 hypothetical protein [Crenobacter sp. SG2303]